MTEPDLTKALRDVMQRYPKSGLTVAVPPDRGSTSQAL
jgi:hypothetical protein